MNGQERFIAALKCEPVDKLPCHWHGPEPAGLYIKQLKDFLDRDDNPELEQCFEISPIGDLTMTNWYSRGTSTDIGIGAGGIGFPAVYYNRKKNWFYTTEEAKTLPVEERNFTISMTGNIRQYGYQLGKPGERPAKYWWEIGKFFDGDDSLERFNAFYNEFGHPWEGKIDPGSDSIKYARARIKDFKEYGFPHAVEGHAPNHFEAIWGGFGAATLAKLSRTKPGVLKDICKKFEKVCLTIEQAHLEAGHQIISTGDDLGQKDRSLVSPKVYHEFFFPALKSRCDLAHKYGAVIWMHSCGFIEELLGDFLEAGLDGLQSLEVPAGNDLARIRAKVRDKMCLIGGIDSSRVMTFDTPAECDAHVKKQIKNATWLDGASLDSGYIPGPAHDLLDTPFANVQAVIKAIGKYCTCPIH
nr:uroporphyrinogen decarboxylase family protein [Candidatus Sigynarchaeota archaeon]